MDIAKDILNNLNLPNKIYEACYKYYLEPDILKKQAETEVEIALIKQKGEFELLERAKLRALKEEQNIQSVLDKTSKYITNEESINEPNEDWMAYFFDKVKLVSDDSLQEIWSKLLAGELESPGKVRKRLIDLIACMDQKDCKDFEILSNFIFYENNSIPRLLIKNLRSESLYKDLGLSHTVLVNLVSLGVINYNIITNITLEYPNSQGMVILSTLDNRFSATFTRNTNSFQFDGVELTSLGIELAKLINFGSSKYSFDYLKKFMITHNNAIEMI